MKPGMIAAASALAVSLAAPAWAQSASKEEVVEFYADLALAKYEDSLATARALDVAIDDFIAEPTEENLAAAKEAWLAARVPYQQTEVYRFGNAAVDDWEGRVNAWPLDEGLIDYVAPAYGTESDANAFYTVNVVANPSLSVGGGEIDASEITPELLSSTLHEIDEVEANVATGYHAIEFLLWGQDLNGTDAGAGERPASDFDTASCTNGNCDRRADYLAAATDLLVSDLEDIVASWSEGGEAREALDEAGPDGAVSAILTGMGSLSYGELAGERMKLGLLLHDPEEEHDCFSDNTHNSHYYDIVGIQNVWQGRYERVDGTVLEGPSVEDLVAADDPALAEEVSSKLAATQASAEEMVARAEGGEAYDQMIGEGNDEGNAVVQAVIDGLVDQTTSIERAVAALELDSIEFEGSDSLDDPDAVFQ